MEGEDPNKRAKKSNNEIIVISDSETNQVDQATIARRSNQFGNQSDANRNIKVGNAPQNNQNLITNVQFYSSEDERIANSFSKIGVNDERIIIHSCRSLLSDAKGNNWINLIMIYLKSLWVATW